MKKEEEFTRMMNELEATVGLKNLKAVHVNDSKSALDSSNHIFDRYIGIK